MPQLPRAVSPNVRLSFNVEQTDGDDFQRYLDARRDQPADFRHLVGPWSRCLEHRMQNVIIVARNHPWARVENLGFGAMVHSKVETRLICRFGHPTTYGLPF